MIFELGGAISLWPAHKWWALTACLPLCEWQAAKSKTEVYSWTKETRLRYLLDTGWYRAKCNSGSNKAFLEGRERSLNPPRLSRRRQSATVFCLSANGRSHGIACLESHSRWLVGLAQEVVFQILFENSNWLCGQFNAARFTQSCHRVRPAITFWLKSLFFFLFLFSRDLLTWFLS